jgi:hypothetical protein
MHLSASRWGYDERAPERFNDDLHPADVDHDDQDRHPALATDLNAVFAELGASISPAHRERCRPMPQ